MGVLIYFRLWFLLSDQYTADLCIIMPAVINFRFYLELDSNI